MHHRVVTCSPQLVRLNTSTETFLRHTVLLLTEIEFHFFSQKKKVLVSFFPKQFWMIKIVT